MKVTDVTNALKETSSVPDKEVELSLSATEIKLCRMMKRVELLGEIRTLRGTNIDTEHAQQHRDHDGGMGEGKHSRQLPILPATF